MKRIYKINTLFISVFLVTSLSSCNKQTNAEIDENKGHVLENEVQYYNNNDFNDYVLNNNSSIKNQWENYGLSSPFILKHNGFYYLYSSTTSNDNENGVRAWKSRDLLNWEVVTAPGLKSGYVVSTTTGESAKARGPEVYYYDGNFYMYESYNDGAGHFILKSSSPEGPFVPLSKASVDNKKDGTIFFGKNENPYFFTASKGNINISTMQGMEAIIDTNLAVNGTTVDSKMYAESPAVFEKDGKYFLLYSTGYDSLSGYHINYAVSDGWENETPSDVAFSFKEGKQNLLINTNNEKGFVGLGHPSVVLGPDLNSYYLAYDCLNSGKYNNHSFNIDRLLVDDEWLSIKHNRYNSIAPQMPEFFSDDITGFTSSDGYYLSNKETEDTFSIEYNFVSAQDSELVFSYVDKNNYAYLKVDLTNSIKLCQKVDGVSEVLKEVNFYNYFKNTDLHTIRVNYHNGLLDVYFENSLKINDFSLSLSGGKVGYLSTENLIINYTAFSNVAGSLSDKNEFKQSSDNILSTMYKEDDYKLSAPAVKGENSYKHISLKHNEYVRYNLNFNKTAYYGVEFLVSSKLKGKQVIVEIDNQDNVVLDIPNVYKEDDYIRVLAGNLYIEEGIHEFKIQGLNDEFEFISFTFKEKADSNYVLYSKLNSENETRGLSFFGDSRWSFIDNKMISLNNYRNVALTNEDNLSDFDLSVDMALIGTDSIFSETSESGIAFRCSEYVSYEDYMSVHNDVTMWNNRYYALRGYYLAFTTRKITLYRFDMTLENNVTIDVIKYASSGKKEMNVILKVRGSRFDLFINNKPVVSFFDSLGYTSGAIGLYATGAETSYRNLKIVGK